MANNEEKKPGLGKVDVKIIKASESVKKATASNQPTGGDTTTLSEWLNPKNDLEGLSKIVSHSSILPQCVKAYKSNISGFGIGVRYKNDDTTDENKEAYAEFTKAEEIIDLLNMDMDTKELFEDLVALRETYGISYTEVIRNLSGEAVGLELIQDPNTIRKTAPLDPYIDIEYPYKDRVEVRARRFCKYKQTVGMKIVYYKECGDPRVMDKRDGTYLKEGKSLEKDYHANEILEFAIGTEAYGEVRWIGQILGIDGSRNAEELNNDYFKEGRHTPMLILIKGGMLTNESFDKMQKYMDGIKGKEGRHAFMVLEAESAEVRTELDDEKTPDIEIVPLASMLQKDELFQDYLENNRKRVQSSFLLPDLYVGYTSDFNRATAQAAIEVTEQQVFQPERTSLSWAINNKLLAGYRFKHVEAYFKAPNISNPEDLSTLLTICERAGGLPPNKAKQIAYEALGETSEDYPSEFGELPLAYWRSARKNTVGYAVADDSVIAQVDDQIEKAAKSKDEEIVAVMKAVRSMLKKGMKGGNVS